MDQPHIHLLLCHDAPDVLQDTVIQPVAAPRPQEAGVHAGPASEPRIAAGRRMHYRPGLQASVPKLSPVCAAPRES